MDECQPLPVITASSAFTITCELVQTTVARSGSLTRAAENEVWSADERYSYSRTLASIRDVVVQVEIGSQT